MSTTDCSIGSSLQISLTCSSLWNSWKLIEQIVNERCVEINKSGVFFTISPSEAMYMAFLLLCLHTKPVKGFHYGMRVKVA
jgi:hypothetical protein